MRRVIMTRPSVNAAGACEPGCAVNALEDESVTGFMVDNLHSRCHLHASQEPNSTLIDLGHIISLASLFSRLHRPFSLCGVSHRSALSRWCAACPTGDWC